jgi:ribonuclease HII
VARRPRPFDPARAAEHPAAIGVDEVGRGALCGPVVVAAVWFEPAALDPAILGALDDSKRLSAAERARLAAALDGRCRAAFAAASAAAVDRIGVRAATLTAMTRAALRLGGDGPVLVDGRDALMARLARRWPGYGWERNAGYGVAAHRAAMRRIGLTPHHRRSFALKDD